MALLTYQKLAHVTAAVTAGTLTRAALVAAVTAGETMVVNVKGLMLTAAQVQAHLDGTVDGESLVRPTGIPCRR